MSAVLLVARIVLATVFAVAGVAKLVDRAGMRRALDAFGVDGWLVSPMSIVLPLAELTIAILLVPRVTARGAGLIALVVLVVFALAIARLIARGQRPDCNCFGAAAGGPVGRGALVRNVLLACLAGGIVFAGPGRGVNGLLAGVDLALVGGVTALVLALAVQAWFSYQLFRQNGRLIERVRALEEAALDPEPGEVWDGLPEGAPAPAFELPDLDGRQRSLQELLGRGAPLALAFIDPACGACGPLLPRLAQLRAEGDGQLSVALLTRGSPEEARRQVNGYAFDAVLLQDRQEVAEAYGAGGVPSAVLVRADGVIGTQVAVGAQAIERLFDTGGDAVTVHLDARAA